MIARVAGGSTHYYHFDALGSTRLLTDDSGLKTDDYSYDAWGKVTGRTGTTAQPYQYVGQLGYYTHVQDANMDLLQLGVRFYDPETGRFTQVDRMYSDFTTSYVYVADGPLIYTDSSGLEKDSFMEKAEKCIGKCVAKCVTAPPIDPTDADNCFLECFAKCMGNSLTKASCVKYHCKIYPDSMYCLPSTPRNPCDRDQSNTDWCESCCGVKYNCCLATTGWRGPLNPEACRKDHDACIVNCSCKGGSGT